MQHVLAEADRRQKYLRDINIKLVLTHSYNKSQQDALFLNFILVKNSTCFGQTYCPSSGVLTHLLP